MQENDYKWFLKNYSTLYKEFGTTYLGIKNEKIVGTFKSYAEGVRAMLEKEKPGTFIVQLCNGNETAYTNYISSFVFN